MKKKSQKTLIKKETFSQAEGWFRILFVLGKIYISCLFFETYVTSTPAAYIQYCIRKSSFTKLNLAVLEMSQSSGNVKVINGEVKDREPDIKMYALRREKSKEGKNTRK